MTTRNSMSAHDAKQAKESGSAGPNRRPLILVLLVLSLLFVVSYTGRLGTLARTQGKIALKEQQIKDARQRQAALLDEQRYVEGAGYLDDVARGEMGMGQRSEDAVVVVKESGPEESLTGETQASAPAVNDDAQIVVAPIWRQWLALFVQQQG